MNTFWRMYHVGQCWTCWLDGCPTATPSSVSAMLSSIFGRSKKKTRRPSKTQESPVEALEPVKRMVLTVLMIDHILICLCVGSSETTFG